MKRNLEVVGKAIVASTAYHLSNTNTYIAAGAIGLGAGLAHKSVKKGVLTGITAAWGMIGLSSFDAIDTINKRAWNLED